MHSDPVIVARALQAGATGYVVKDTSPENFIEAFKKVRVGMRYLSDDLAMQVAFANAPGRENPLAEPYPSGIANTIACWLKVSLTIASRLTLI